MPYVLYEKHDHIVTITLNRGKRKPNWRMK